MTATDIVLEKKLLFGVSENIGRLQNWQLTTANMTYQSSLSTKSHIEILATLLRFFSLSYFLFNSLVLDPRLYLLFL